MLWLVGVDWNLAIHLIWLLVRAWKRLLRGASIDGSGPGDLENNFLFLEFAQIVESLDDPLAEGVP